MRQWLRKHEAQQTTKVLSVLSFQGGYEQEQGYTQVRPYSNKITQTQQVKHRMKLVVN